MDWLDMAAGGSAGVVGFGGCCVCVADGSHLDWGEALGTWWMVWSTDVSSPVARVGRCG